MPSDPAEPDAAPGAVVQRLLAGLDADHREVAPGEWGLTTDCAGRPLHVGIALRGGLLRAQAEAVGPGRLDAALLLHRNRLTPLVRYAQSRAGAVWVHGDLPATTVDDAALDRLLALLLEAAAWARYAAADASSPPA